MAVRNIVATRKMDAQAIIELWKAIHGGCWPGPYPELRLTVAVREVLSGVAALNLAGAFADDRVRGQMVSLAKESLKQSLNELAQEVAR